MRLFSLFEVVFACAAEGAFPISRDISKSSTGLYAVVRVAFSGVVNVATYLAFKFVHVLNSFQLLTCQLFILYPRNGKSNRGNKNKKEKHKGKARKNTFAMVFTAISWVIRKHRGERNEKNAYL